MRKETISLLGVVLAGLFLTGCAAFQTSTTQIPPKLSEEKPTADKALIIVEGSDSWAGMIKLYACAVFDNQTPVGKVGPHGKLVWLRDPGLMEIKLNPGAGRILKVAGGEKYQFKVECNSSLIYSFAGPGVPINQLPKQNAAYIKHKIETTLGVANCVNSMVVYGNILIITLNVAPVNEENDCLKAMGALSQDPQAAIGEGVCICAEQLESFSKGIGKTALRGALLGLAGYTGSIDSTRDKVTTFSCRITRDGLLKGEAPVIGIRNGVFVSGVYEGQATDSWWLHEKK